MENAKNFFEEIAKTEEAKALFKAAEKPESEEARIAAYIEIAKKFGIELTAEGISAYIATVTKADSDELDDEELSQLAGGVVEKCFSTFQNRENCILSDACDNFYIEYVTYYCDKYSKDGSGMR